VPAPPDSRPEGAPTTTPLFIVLNAGSGHQDTDATFATIERVLRGAGRPHEILRVADPAQLAETARRAVAAAKASGGMVVAAGGDGTLNTVAQATLGSGCPFGVIPQGTFNYFGRAHGISSDTEQATRALLRGRIRPVQVGQVNDRAFLVNASLGLYPKSLDEREVQKRRYGRSRVVAAWAAVVTLWRGVRPLRLELQHGGVRRHVRALTLFVGNNRLQMEQVGLHEVAGLDGKLAVVLVRPRPLPSLLWLLARGAMGALRQAPGVEHFALADLSVQPSRGGPRRMKIATDGETAWMTTPIRFRVAPEPLLLWEPADAAPESA
jgi:diacylglycerol kinase family enzyme